MGLADPRLGIAVHVEPLHQLEIAFHAQERIFVIGMKRRQEDPMRAVWGSRYSPPERRRIRF